MNFSKSKLYPILKIKNENSIYIASIITGLFTGSITYVFVYLLEKADLLFETYFPGYTTPEIFGNDNVVHLHFGYWMFIFLPAIGGLLSGLVSHKLSRETSGSGMDSFIDSFHQMEGKLRGRIALYKIFTSLFTIGSGGSAGREGPIAQIGGSIGSKFNDLLGGGPKARRTLLLAGAAGGLGAIFHAPLGGALSAVEMIYREDIESDALLPCIISSMSSYLLYSSLVGFHSLYSPTDVVGVQPFVSYPFYIVLGFLSYCTGNIFIQIFNKVKSVFDKLPVHNVLKPAIGGLLVGIIGFFFPVVLGTGESFVHKMIEFKIETVSVNSIVYLGGTILFIIFLKIIATSLTIGSGGSGGMFGPSLYIGGLIGLLIGLLARFFLPGSPITLSSFMLVGMGAFYSGIARAPIAAMIMICEMIGSYVLLPPLMIGSIITLILSHNIAIYTTQLSNRFKSPAHSYDLDIMQKILISQYTEFLRNNAVVPKDMSLHALKLFGKKIQASDFIVSGNNSEYCGIITLKKKHALHEDLLEDSSPVQKKGKVKFVGDVTEKIPAVTLNNTLGDALNVILEYDVDKVGVTSDDKLIGYFRFNDLMKFYYQKINKHKILAKNKS